MHSTGRGRFSRAKSLRRLQKEKGIPDRHVHCMALSQFPYNDELAAKCGGSKTPAWRLSLVMHTMELWGKYSAIQYRDEWEDEEALSNTYAAFEAIRKAQQVDR